MGLRLLLLTVAVCAHLASSAYVIPHSVANERPASYWHHEAQQELNDAISGSAVPIVNVAKNVIIFLGDGMGISTVTAARILAGQMQGGNGEEYQLAFDKFPHVALSRTYNVDHQTADSASTATAYLCGVKTIGYTLGITAQASFGDCSSLHDNMKTTSILDWSMAAGKATGVVTTTRVTHATPAASYAHSVHRDWEGYVPTAQRPCKDIAQQLVYDNPDINVVMGGGRQEFFPQGWADPEGGHSARHDNLNLVQDWLSHQQGLNRRAKYVWNLTDFNSVDAANTDYLFGLFNPSHMEYEMDRASDHAGEPSLAEMTEKAIQVLSKNPNGFFLLVEGGRIDHGHHDGRAYHALHDTVAFSDAVAKAVSITNKQDTLILTTADHSHTMMLSGYPGRGNNIFGKVQEGAGIVMADDREPYTTLVYGNGPGATPSFHHAAPGRHDPTPDDTTDPHYRQQAIVPMGSETHGGEDVAIFAQGPMSHLFHGVHQQSYIAHVMAYASCVGSFNLDKDCARSLTSQSVPVGK